MLSTMRSAYPCCSPPTDCSYKSRLAYRWLVDLRGRVQLRLRRTQFIVEFRRVYGIEQTCFQHLYPVISPQQTIASIAARMCAAAILPAGLTQTNLGHAAFYRIRRPVWRDAVALPVGAGCDLIGA